MRSLTMIATAGFLTLASTSLFAQATAPASPNAQSSPPMQGMSQHGQSQAAPGSEASADGQPGTKGGMMAGGMMQGGCPMMQRNAKMAANMEQMQQQMAEMRSMMQKMQSK